MPVNAPQRLPAFLFSVCLFSCLLIFKIITSVVCLFCVYIIVCLSDINNPVLIIPFVCKANIPL